MAEITTLEEAKKVIEELRGESASKRKKIDTLESELQKMKETYSEIESKYKEIEKQKKEQKENEMKEANKYKELYESLLVEKEQYSTQLSDKEKAIQELSEFREKIFNDKIEKIQDEKTKELAKKYQDIELINKFLEAQNIQSNSAGAQNMNNNNVNDITKMDLEQRERFSFENPEEYNRQIFKKFTATN